MKGVCGFASVHAFCMPPANNGIFNSDVALRWRPARSLSPTGGGDKRHCRQDAHHLPSGRSWPLSRARVLRGIDFKTTYGDGFSTTQRSWPPKLLPHVCSVCARSAFAYRLALRIQGNNAETYCSPFPRYYCAFPAKVFSSCVFLLSFRRDVLPDFEIYCNF